MDRKSFRMNSVTTIVLFLYVSFSQAHDCLCPIDQPLVIFNTPYTSNEKHSIKSTTDCLIITSHYRAGYSVDLEGVTGYVNIDTGRIENNCEPRTKDVKTRRFILGDLSLGMLTMASAASCYISCSSCSCETVGTRQQHCWDVLPCKPCKELVCYKNKTETNTSPPSTTTTSTVIDHCNSSPCQNGGECRNKHDSYKCFCKTKYTPTHYEIYIGLNCDVGFKYNFSHQTTNLPHTTVSTVQHTDVPSTKGPFSTTLKQATASHTDPCRSSPCLNGGLCVQKNQSYTCYCQSAPHGSIITTGNRCELQIDLSKTQSPSTTSWLVIKGK